MKKITILFIVLMVVINSFGQTQTFDIVTYTAPKGWSEEIKDFAASYVTTNNKTKTWCRITIYKSIKSSDDPAVDFSSEWNSLMVKNNYGEASPPKPVVEEEDGWTSNSGVSAFKFENRDAYSLLSTISGYGVEVSIVVLMNSQEFMKDVEKMLGSIDLKKPDIKTIDAPTKPEQPTQLAITKEPGNNGISMSTTNFDDGWMAQPFIHYVQVTKGPVTVLLHYPVKVTDEMRNSGDVEAAMFDLLVLPRYNVTNIRKYNNDGFCYFCVYFYEADAVEKSTGKKYHLGFRIFTKNGISNCVEIISPSSAVFQLEFPNQEKVETMLNYNKFAVTISDLVGTWDESSGSYVDMYNTVTGTYAGMNSSSSSNSFTFNGDGTYNSNHKGAFGMVGNMKFYDQKYNGTYKVTNWDITATKRFEGKTDVYWAQFEAVRGGRVLHLTDKTASGIQYHLVKSK